MLTRNIAGKRQFRHPTWLFYALLVSLGGPLNPAVWWLGWPDPGETLNTKDLLHILMIPSTVMTCTTLVILRKLRTFDVVEIGAVVAVGLAVAVLTVPIFMGVEVSLRSGRFDFVKFVTASMYSTFFGWFFGVIPYFAVTRGIPCAVALFLIVLGLCRPVHEDDSTPERTD